MDETRQQRIEREAKRVVREQMVDPMILPDFIARLELWEDGAGKYGPPGGLVLRAKGDGSKRPLDVLTEMRADPQFAHRFGEDGKRYYNEPVRQRYDGELTPFEIETREIIRQRLMEIAPGGDLMKVGPSTMINISREVRAERGAGPENPAGVRKHKVPHKYEPVHDIAPDAAMDIVDAARYEQWKKEVPPEASQHLPPPVPQHVLNREAVARQQAADRRSPPARMPDYVAQLNAMREKRGY